MGRLCAICHGPLLDPASSPATTAACWVCREGIRQLIRRLTRDPGTGLPPLAAPGPPGSTGPDSRDAGAVPPAWLVVVHPARPALHAHLCEILGDRVVVILDGRRRERRTRYVPVPYERRRGERRRALPEPERLAWRQAGYLLVPRVRARLEA